MGSNFGPTLAQRLSPSVERLYQLMSATGQNIRVALVGIVQSFDPGPPATVSVQIATKENLQWDPSGPSGSVSVQITSNPLPLLPKVPVQIIGAGIWTLTFPIQPGDECLLICADTAITAWLQSGGIVNPVSTRRHSLSDAIALFGMRSTPRSLPDYSTTSTQLRSDDGTVVIDLAPDTITITAPNVNVDCENATVTASDTAEIDAATANVVASGNAKVQGNSVHITGSSVTIGTGTTIDGKNFLLHSHTGVTTGVGTSGPVA